MNPKKFEIYYSDKTCMYGDSRDGWLLTPDQDVQFLVIEWEDGSQEKIAGQDEYELFNYTKYGRWTTRDNYNEIVKIVDEESRIFNGG